MCENATVYPMYPLTTDINLNSNKSKHYEDDIFKCDNGRCVNYMQLCNRIDDCGDLSDEIDCPQQIMCKSTINSTNPKFIYALDKCDRKVDCFDWSDECNDSCGREILGSWMLKITCCFMGILAMVFNSVSLFHGVGSIIHDCPTENMLMTKVLMCLIGSGDFLMGVYLIVLFTYDSLVYGSSYCQHQPKWLTGTPCMVLGVISTVGSQVSLFSMTVLSCIIMYGVVFKKMTISGRVTRTSLLRVSTLALIIPSISLFIAVVPLVPSLKDSFVSRIYFGADIGKFYGLAHKWYVSPSHYNSWSDINDYMEDTFLKPFGDVPRYPVHFYGNDGNCLFRYFFRTGIDGSNQLDPYSVIVARQRIVWTMLTVNSVCFVIIAVCYIAITFENRKSTQDSGQSDNPDRLRDNKAIENRIILIIVTDFLCWVPFTIISGLHNFEYTLDASNWYTPFALTVLPLNSVINPLLYDKILLEFLRKLLRQPWEFLTSKLRNFSFRSAIPGLFSRSNVDVPVENAMPMEVISH